MIRDTAAELRDIAESCTNAAGYFPALYSRVTSEIAESIDRAAFADGERMDVLATDFAQHYIRASRNVVVRPRCWQASWDVVGDDRLLIVQHLLLGINAHINFDLPQATAEAGRRAGDLSRVRSDFDVVNDVLTVARVAPCRISIAWLAGRTSSRPSEAGAPSTSRSELRAIARGRPRNGCTRWMETPRAGTSKSWTKRWRSLPTSSRGRRFPLR